MDIETLLAQPKHLPVMPAVLRRLLADFGREDTSVSEIGRLIGADPVLSAKLLRLANSAYFNVPRTVGCVDDALRLLGFAMVRNLTLGCALVAASQQVRGLDLKRFWRHSVLTACATRWLAQAGGDDAERAFVAGLLHGVGHLVLHAGLPQAMAALAPQAAPWSGARHRIEQERLGYHHGEVGARLAQRWNLPDALVRALRHAPDPLAAPVFDDLAARVHLAAWHARHESASPRVSEPYPDAVGQRLGLDPRAGAMPAVATLACGLQDLLA